MGGATSVLAGYTCHACSMNFSIDPNGERAMRQGGVACPRCNGPAERRAVQVTGAPQLFVTPSGLVMTEDTLRQLLMAQLSPAPGARPEQMHFAIEAMVRGLRQVHDGEGMDSALLEAINRSISESQSQQAPPAAAKLVENLPHRTWKAGEHPDDECSICLASYEDGDDLAVLPCSHLMHAECLMPWLKQTNSCPLCRHQLDTDSPEYEDRRRQQERVRVAEREAARPNPINTNTSSSPGGRAGSDIPASFSGEFGVHRDRMNEVRHHRGQGGGGVSTNSRTSVAADNAIISPSSLSRDSSATASPASRGLGGMRRGFLQDRATRGFGEEHSHSPQLAAGASIAGECVCARARAYVCIAGRKNNPQKQHSAFTTTKTKKTDSRLRAPEP